MQPTMRAGTLDQRIVIQSAAYAKSASGEDIATWEDFATISAAVRFPRGKSREKFAADRDNAEQWVEVEVRRIADIVADMRVLWTSYTMGDVVMDIRGVEPPTDRASNMFLTCRIVK